MNQNIWGPHLWFVLHTITFNYPINPTKEDKKNYKKFLYSLKEILPCSICRKHYKRHLKHNPPIKALENRDEFIKWMIDLHNEVNGETGKKNTYTYHEIINRYERIYNMKIVTNLSEMESEQNKGKCNLNYYYQIVILILILIIFILIKNKFYFK